MFGFGGNAPGSKKNSVVDLESATLVSYGGSGSIRADGYYGPKQVKTSTTVERRNLFSNKIPTSNSLYSRVPPFFEACHSLSALHISKLSPSRDCHRLSCLSLPPSLPPFTVSEPSCPPFLSPSETRTHTSSPGGISGIVFFSPAAAELKLHLPLGYSSVGLSESLGRRWLRGDRLKGDQGTAWVGLTSPLTIYTHCIVYTHPPTHPLRQEREEETFLLQHQRYGAPLLRSTVHTERELIALDL